jgi:uncharacterized alpha-E superfamily protein
MLSRVGDAIYWMSRYIERAENVARFINANFHMILDLPQEQEQWNPLVSTTGDEPIFAERYGAPTRENVVRFLTFDTSYGSSILSSLRAARENARSVREHITTEMWEQLNTFFLSVRDAATGTAPLESPHEFYSGIMRASHQFSGTTDATMAHGEGWHFAVLGRLLERADKTSRILDAKYYVLLPSVSYVGTVYDDIQWAAVLRSTSALQMYRQRFGQISPSRVVEFLLLSAEFPRAVRFCLIQAEESLRAISGTPRSTFRNRAEQRLGQLRAELDYALIEDIIKIGVHEFVDGLQSKVNGIGEAIFDTFFAVRPTGEGAAFSLKDRA